MTADGADMGTPEVILKDWTAGKGGDSMTAPRYQHEPEPLPDFEESLTGFERLEMALDTWLSTDTGEHTEELLQATAEDAANWINGLLEQAAEGGHHGQNGNIKADKNH